MADPRVPSDTPVDVRIGADKCQEGKLRKEVEYTGTHCCLYEAERVRINGVEFFFPRKKTGALHLRFRGQVGVFLRKRFLLLLLMKNRIYYCRMQQKERNAVREWKKI